MSSWLSSGLMWTTPPCASADQRLPVGLGQDAFGSLKFGPDESNLALVDTEMFDRVILHLSSFL